MAEPANEQSGNKIQVGGNKQSLKSARGDRFFHALVAKTWPQRPVAVRIPKDSRLYPDHVRRPTGSTLRARCEWMATEMAFICHKDLIVHIAMVFSIEQYLHSRSSQGNRTRAFQDKFACTRLTKRLVCGRRAQVGRGSQSWDRPGTKRHSAPTSAPSIAPIASLVPVRV